jgi:hypothetical protein
MIARQEVLDDNEPFFENVVICSTSSEFDKTVMTFKEAISISNLIAVRDSNLLDWVNQYISKVLLYNTVMKFIKKKFKNPSDEMFDIIVQNKLNTKEKLIEWIAKTLVDIGWKTYPHRLLLILDDYASHPQLKSKDAPLSRMLKKLRHFNISVIICVQTVKSIPKDLKRNMSDLVLFTGISEEDFIYLIRESSASCFDYKKLWNVYRIISDKHALMCLHIEANKVFIHPSNTK